MTDLKGLSYTYRGDCANLLDRFDMFEQGADGLENMHLLKGQVEAIQSVLSTDMDMVKGQQARQGPHPTKVAHL